MLGPRCTRIVYKRSERVAGHRHHSTGVFTGGKQAIHHPTSSRESAKAKEIAANVDNVDAFEFTSDSNDDSLASRIVLRHAHHLFRDEEREAAKNVVRFSPHSFVTILPNHHLNQKGELLGFHFQTPASAKARALPIGHDTFKVHAIYDVTGHQAYGTFHKTILQYLVNKEHVELCLKELMAELSHKTSSPQDTAEEADFSCLPTSSGMHEWNTLNGEQQDARVWADECPESLGLYHSIWRDTNSKENTHRLFIAMTCNLRRAADELHNLWQDIDGYLTAEEFVNSAEMQWLRQATLRSCNRVAYRLAQRLGISTQAMSTRDIQDPNRAFGLIPTTFTYINDYYIQNGHVHATNLAAFTDIATNGIIFSNCPSEGYYVFRGVTDRSDLSNTGSGFGSVWNTQGGAQAFPASTIVFSNTFPPHAQDHEHIINDGDRYFFPDRLFMFALEDLGWNSNNGFVSLMPIASALRDDLTV